MAGSGGKGAKKVGRNSRKPGQARYKAENRRDKNKAKRIVDALKKSSNPTNSLASVLKQVDKANCSVKMLVHKDKNKILLAAEKNKKRREKADKQKQHAFADTQLSL